MSEMLEETVSERLGAGKEFSMAVSVGFPVRIHNGGRRRPWPLPAARRRQDRARDGAVHHFVPIFMRERYDNFNQ
jgi:hypothetical protein